MSFSGLGTMAGSPIGGKDQVDKNGKLKKYTINCRWTPETLVKNIWLANKYLNSVCDAHSYGICTSHDYVNVLEHIYNESFVYLDPPYFGMGEQLYQQSFTIEDHKYLSHKLQLRKNWLLSYDNHPEIRKLYDWANIEEIPIKYTITNNTEQCKELLIFPKD